MHAHLALVLAHNMETLLSGLVSDYQWLAQLILPSSIRPGLPSDLPIVNSAYIFCFLSCALYLCCPPITDLGLYPLYWLFYELKSHCLSVTDLGSCLHYVPVICPGASKSLHLVLAKWSTIIWFTTPTSTQSPYCLQQRPLCVLLFLVNTSKGVGQKVQEKTPHRLSLQQEHDTKQHCMDSFNESIHC